jgi:hypothetical protein
VLEIRALRSAHQYRLVLFLYLAVAELVGVLCALALVAGGSRDTVTGSCSERDFERTRSVVSRVPQVYGSNRMHTQPLPFLLQFQTVSEATVADDDRAPQPGAIASPGGIPMKRSLTILLAAATLAVPAAAITAGSASAASRPAATGSVVVNGRCSKGSLSNLQAQREDTGKLSIDFGVDMARHTAGVAWKVKETNNGGLVVATTVRTIADGSFSITRLVTPKPGVNHIAAIAANPSTGEMCFLRASV